MCIASHRCDNVLTFSAEPHETILISTFCFCRPTFFFVAQCQRHCACFGSRSIHLRLPRRRSENANEARFLAVPDPKLAEEHLRVLTQAPHMAGTPEDKATADYVAQKFRDCRTRD